MRSTTHPSRPNAIVDPDSVTRNQGRQIDFSKASIRYQQGAVRINLTGAAARGATSLAVDALTSDLPVDTILNFGNIANVAVVVGVAGAAVDATSVPVAALSGAIPSGTVLDFGGKKFARLTAAAAAGATALTVDELALPVPAASVAYALGEVGSKRIPALTVMAQLASGLCIPRADVTGAETAQFVLETDAQEGSVSDSKSGYGMMTGAHVFENLLPDADPTTGLIPAGWKTELRAFGGAWIFEQYADSR
jgi:hypothetical protein